MAGRKVTVEMAVRFVKVPAEELLVWRRGIARMYEELEEMVESDRESSIQDMKGEIGRSPCSFTS